MGDISLKAIAGVPWIEPGEDVPAVITRALDAGDHALQSQDVVVVAQKIVSKAENRYVDLTQVEPGREAYRLGSETNKDPRLVEIILRESRSVLRYRPGLLVVRHRLGLVMANAGVDQSNIDAEAGERVLLLPADPDASARRIKTVLDEHYGADVGVVISDSAGRPWRNGIVGIALGTAGMPPVRDMCGRKDLSGRPLQATFSGFADGIAAAATLSMGESDEGLPLVLVRGLSWHASEPASAGLLRDPELDLFS